jgi:hypothetical protein
MKTLFALTALSTLLLTACGNTQTPPAVETTPTAAPTAAPSQSGDNSAETAPTAAPQLVVKLNGLSSELTNFDQKTKCDAEDVTVNFNGSSATIKGEGCSVQNAVLSITTPGTYVLSGSFNGQVSVSVDKAEKVRLVLNNASITCSDGPAIIITSADKVGITLADGTTNTLSDGKTYADTSDKAPNACVFSKDDLSINGNGTLNVTANFHNGIDTSNDLKLVSGTINVTAKNHALKGNDSVSVFGGTITVNGGNDGIKSDTEGEAGKGFFYMNGGTLDVTAVDDGIQAISSIRIDNGSVSFHVQDDATNCDGSIAIAEGVVK